MTAEVTAVLVTHGGAELVGPCLAALRARTPVDVRVVVVDSGSDAATVAALRTCADIDLLVEWPENIGFGLGCSVGLRHVDTELLLLLNADVLVRPGWFPPLEHALRREGVGAASPLLLHPDGSVQEAGSVVGSDGFARARTEPSVAELVPAAVTYASAACLLLRSEDLRRVGGFDPDFHVAYVEDVELALELRAHGLTTVVEPRSTVEHRRHGSSGSDTATQLMDRNRHVLLRRWGHQLHGLPAVAGTTRDHHLWWLAGAAASARVLFIDDRVPQPHRGRGDPRTLDIVLTWRRLLPDAHLTYFAVLPDGAEDAAPAIRAQGVEVVHGVCDPEAWSRERRGFYDVVVVFRPHNFAGVGLGVHRWQPQARTVYDAEALFHRRPRQQLALAGTSEQRASLVREGVRLRAEEQAAFRWADVGVCVEPDEGGWAAAVEGAGTVVVVGQPVQVHPDERVDPRAGLLFFGGFDGRAGTPNEGALLELVERVLPFVRVPVELTVVGSDPSPAVLALAGRGIRVVGGVPDPVPWLRAARVMVVPLRLGAGLKAKFVDAMASGLPFVTTSVGAQGLGLGPLARHLVAETPERTAELVDALLTDDDLWEHVHATLLTLATEQFSRDRFTAQVAAVVSACGLQPAQPSTSTQQSR